MLVGHEESVFKVVRTQRHTGASFGCLFSAVLSVAAGCKDGRMR